jgi:hypothetical protein
MRMEDRPDCRAKAQATGNGKSDRAVSRNIILIYSI